MFVLIPVDILFAGDEVEVTEVDVVVNKLIFVLLACTNLY